LTNNWGEFLQNGISALEQPLVGRMDSSVVGEDEENTHLAQLGESWSGRRSLTRTKDDLFAHLTRSGNVLQPLSLTMRSIWEK